MSDNNNLVYNIANIMNGNISDEFKVEIMNSIQKLFRDKYINKINQTVQSHYDTTMANPSKEIRFLNMMKEFMHESKHEDINKMINMYNMMNTFNKLKSNMKATYVGNEEEVCTCSSNDDGDSIHEDGIYDIDKSCLIQKEGMKAELISTIMMMIFMENNSMG